MTFNNESILWSERATMRDWWLNPINWLLTVGTFGLYFLFCLLNRLSVRYTLTTERLIIKKGILSNHEDEIELFRIKDVRSSQGFFQRITRTGTVFISSTDESGSLLMKNISTPGIKREEIRNLSRAERKSQGTTIVHE